MKTKHTTGKWQVTTTPSFNQRHIRTICDEDMHPLADIRYKLHATQEENLANAKLIAAAPDLLEAVMFCRSVLESNGIFELSEKLAVEKAQAAIKKATA